MNLITLVLGGFLLGQTGGVATPAAEKAPPPALRPIVQPETDVKPEAAATPGRYHRTPPDLVAEAVAVPPGGTLAGNPLPLVSVLAATPDRRRQLEATHAYWRLAEAVGVYHFTADYRRQLGLIQARSGDALTLRTADASSSALSREAEVVAIAAQHDLAALALLPPDAPLPLPADRPHAGPYRTNYATLFPTRAAPARLKLIDQILPIRWQAIDNWTTAIQAADEAVAAAQDGYRAGRTEMPALLTCMKQALQQRELFMNSVCRYNEEIADYALTIALPNAGGEALLGMLIKPAQEGVRPAAFLQPTPAPTPARRPGRSEPTLAPPRPAAATPEKPAAAAGTPWMPSGTAEAGKTEAGKEPVKNEPTLAPPPKTPEPAGKSEPTLAPPRDEPRMVPVKPESAEPTSRSRD